MQISLVGSTESSDFSKHGDVVMKMRAGAHSFAEVKTSFEEFAT